MSHIQPCSCIFHGKSVEFTGLVNYVENLWVSLKKIPTNPVFFHIFRVFFQDLEGALDVDELSLALKLSELPGGLVDWGG